MHMVTTELDVLKQRIATLKIALLEPEDFRAWERQASMRCYNAAIEDVLRLLADVEVSKWITT